MEGLFWSSLFAVAYPYVGYPLLLLIWNRLTGRRMAEPDLAHMPTVTIVLPVHNEARRIAAKVQNLLELDYDVDRLQLLVIGDGCSDETLSLARYAGMGRIAIHALPSRAGKAAALNAGLALATGDIVVFTDAGIQLEPGSLKRLVGHFADPVIGCVSGEDTIEGGEAEGLYGRLELLLRREETKLHSIAGASGCFYAQRRSLCRPFIAGMAPDFLSVLVTVEAGHRAISEPLARGTMSATSRLDVEFERKKRTFLRGLTALGGHATLLNPFRYPSFSLILWSHKVVRWFAPFPLLSSLVASLVLADNSMYAAFAVVQVSMYLLGTAALISSRISRHLALARVAAFFMLVNTAAIASILMWMRGIRIETWEPTRRPT